MKDASAPYDPQMEARTKYRQPISIDQAGDFYDRGRRRNSRGGNRGEIRLLERSRIPVGGRLGFSRYCPNNPAIPSTTQVMKALKASPP